MAAGDHEQRSIGFVAIFVVLSLVAVARRSAPGDRGGARRPDQAHHLLLAHALAKLLRRRGEKTIAHARRRAAVVPIRAAAVAPRFLEHGGVGGAATLGRGRARAVPSSARRRPAKDGERIPLSGARARARATSEAVSGCDGTARARAHTRAHLTSSAGA